MMTSENNYLTITEAIEYSKISRPAIYAALKKGKLKAVKRGYFWQFTRENLDAYRVSKYNRDDREFNGERIFSPEKGTFSIGQAARILGYELNSPYTPQRLYYLIRRGELKVSRFGSSFIISKEVLIKLIEREKGVVRESKRA